MATKHAKCHEGNCTSCTLCNKPNPKYIHPAHMKIKSSEAYKWLKNRCPNLEDSACICLPCSKQINRNYGNQEFTPRWAPKPEKPTRKCCMEKCQQPLYSSTNLVTAEQLPQILDERVTAFSIDASQTYLGLCQDHYLAMYRQLHQASPCASCGGRPKKGLVFYRHCPNPEQINGYLNVVSNDPLSLTANSTVCYTCYLYFNRVLKQLQSRGDQIQIPAIDSVVGKLSDSMDDIQVKGEGIARDDYLDLVLCVTGLKLATAMKADEVLLLPDLYDFFRSEIVTRAALFPSLGPIPAHDIPGTRWVLAHLSFHFGEMLRVECKHRRFGSLLYHVNCDLLKAVSLALARNRLHVKEVEQESAVAHPPQVSLSWDEQITSVASYLNDRVHQQAKTFVANFRDSPDKYAAFSIEWLYEAVDPHLIKFVQQLTQSVRNRRRKLFDSESEVTNTRRMRQVYLLCTVLFCAISQCSMPFHTLLTEAILCHGGSQELVRILNQVGAVASLETSHRLATLVVQQRIARGIQPELRHRALCVVSIDNIDILQSHAFVSSTDGTRSWHGTSVQCMQPLPLSAYLTDDEMVTAGYQPAGRKHPASSPASSPAASIPTSCREDKTQTPDSNRISIATYHNGYPRNGCSAATERR